MRGKGLLIIWNLVLTVLVVFVFARGCATESQLSTLANQVEANKRTIEQLTAAVNSAREAITAQTAQIVSLNQSVSTSISQASLTLQKYVQDYVNAYLQALAPK